MKPISVVILNQALGLLRYDIATGAFIWLADRRPAITAGDIAGTYDPDKPRARVITIGGHKLLAPSLAWFFAYGEWPAHPVAPIDGDIDNLRVTNLVLRPQAWSHSRKAMYHRRRRDKLRNARHDYDLRHPSDYPAVRYDPSKQDWIVCISNMPERFVSGRFPTRDEAEQFLLEREYGLAFVEANPVPPIKEPPFIYAGDPRYSATLVEFHRDFVYEPLTGAVYRRHPASICGERADAPNTAGTPILSFMSRDYPVHMVAWFLTHKTWPKRKSIIFLDGDKQNSAIANLALRDA